MNGKKKEATNGATNNGTGPGGKPSLAVPQAVVDEALKATRDCLESVCELDENGTT